MASPPCQYKRSVGTLYLFSLSLRFLITLLYFFPCIYVNTLVNCFTRRDKDCFSGRYTLADPQESSLELYKCFNVKLIGRKFLRIKWSNYGAILLRNMKKIKTLHLIRKNIVLCK